MSKLVSLLLRFVTLALLSGLAILLVASVIHIISILLIPQQAQDRLESLVRNADLADRKFSVIEDKGKTAVLLNAQDPNFHLAICPFDLSDGPLSVLAASSQTLWTLAVFNQQSQNVYSLNDRLVSGDKLELLLVSPLQLAELQEVGAKELEKRIVISLKQSQGFVLLRTFKHGMRKQGAVESFIKSAKCETFEELVQDDNAL